MKGKIYSAVNIQWPISRLLLSGEKTIETRTYSIPEKYLGEELLIIETPGKEGKFKARIIGIIKFSECFKYNSSKDFYSDHEKHKVDRNSPWAWADTKPKWAWVVENVIPFKKEITFPGQKGIKFTNNITL